LRINDAPIFARLNSPRNQPRSAAELVAKITNQGAPDFGSHGKRAAMERRDYHLALQNSFRGSSKAA
jgi:hypothetical protein